MVATQHSGSDSWKRDIEEAAGQIRSVAIFVQEKGRSHGLSERHEFFRQARALKDCADLLTSLAAAGDRETARTVLQASWSIVRKSAVAVAFCLGLAADTATISTALEALTGSNDSAAVVCLEMAEAHEPPILDQSRDSSSTSADQTLLNGLTDQLRLGEISEHEFTESLKAAGAEVHRIGETHLLIMGPDLDWFQTVNPDELS